MKAHLIISECPIHDGFPVTSLCDLEISPCQIVMMWDSVAMNSPLAFSTLLCCKRCWESLAMLAEISPRYIYGVVKAQQVPEEEHEMEVAA